MPTQVFINNREACSKAADGKSAGAFPDPCFSPPGPPASPGCIRPYSNTAYAKDLANGTTSVFIRGKPVAREDLSYFATSTGNEGATPGFKKGVGTGAITGKAYFTGWSPDVFFEGYGVPRHLDNMTHNHGSFPSNTPVFPYIDHSFLRGNPCKKEEDRIDKACKPEHKEGDLKKELRSKSKLAKALQKMRGQQRSKRGVWHWTDDHCDGLHIPMRSAEVAKAELEKYRDALEAGKQELAHLETLRPMLVDAALHAGKEALAKWAAKAAVKQVAGTSLPALGNAAMAIWSVVDGISAISNIADIKATATQVLEQLDVVKEKFGEISQLAEKLKNPSPEDIQKLVADSQDLLATVNDCTRARKCNLVPYRTGAGRGGKVEPANSGGCCPGQTGHHLIPSGSIEDSCPGYNANTAPTVCVEGTNQAMGSHGRVHGALAEVHEKLKREGKLTNGTMSMDQSTEAAADSHEKAFPLSRCSKACILAQLKSHYDKLCPNARPYAVNKAAQKAKPNINE